METSGPPRLTGFIYSREPNLNTSLLAPFELFVDPCIRAANHSRLALVRRMVPWYNLQKLRYLFTHSYAPLALLTDMFRMSGTNEE